MPLYPILISEREKENKMREIFDVTELKRLQHFNKFENVDFDLSERPQVGRSVI